ASRSTLMRSPVCGSAPSPIASSSAASFLRPPEAPCAHGASGRVLPRHTTRLDADGMHRAHDAGVGEQNLVPPRERSASARHLPQLRLVAHCLLDFIA